MSKTTEKEQQPAHVAELLLNGTAVLEAPTREALAEIVNGIPTECKYMVGAVGHNGSAYTLQVDIIKN